MRLLYRLPLYLMAVSLSACNINSVGASDSVFTEDKHFFNASDMERQLRDIKSKYCPDGSEFIALDKNLVDGEFEYTATCYYEHSLGYIEHIWYGKEKFREYSVFNDLKVGLERFKLSPNLQGVAKFCDGKVSYIELYDRKMSLKAVFINLQPTYTSIEKAIEFTDVHINFSDENVSFGEDNIGNYKPCDYKFVEEEKLAKWLNWNWKYDFNDRNK